uniref:Uncharacterized protein n=1 Tax=Rangifer tarandus platyrhynchus TaxID=3082113 RepID=A0ACB0EVS2_RANTA|nr:unnamed protein product [Rangifer tarandus platyrhynchus]
MNPEEVQVCPTEFWWVPTATVEVNRGQHRPRWPPSPSDPPVLGAAPRQSGPSGAWRGAGAPRDWPKPFLQP